MWSFLKAEGLMCCWNVYVVSFRDTIDSIIIHWHKANIPNKLAFEHRGADLPNYALTTKPNHNPAVNAGKPQKLLPTKIWAHLPDLETLYFAIRVGNKGKTRYHRGVLGLKVNHNDVYICRRCWGLYLVHQTLTGQVNLASAALSWEVRRPAGFQP